MTLDFGHVEAGASETVLLEHISKRFGSTEAVKDVSLRSRSGEVHAVLGENGAGKSTLGKIMGGLVQPDEGTVFINGRETRLRSVAEARNNGFAMVFQGTVPRPRPDRERRTSAWNRFRQKSIQPHRQQGGKRKMCGAFREIRLRLRSERARTEPFRCQSAVDRVVKALMRKPRVLILDEPTAMLGVRENEKLLSIIRSARSQGLAVIFITHHVEEVVEVAHRVSPKVRRPGRVLRDVGTYGRGFYCRQARGQGMFQARRQAGAGVWTTGLRDP